MSIENLKWIEITPGIKDPRFLQYNYPTIVYFIQNHSKLFSQESKINFHDLSWFSKHKLFALYNQDVILALMKESIPFTMKSGLIEHELIVLETCSIKEQISYLDLFQKKILIDLPKLCQISAFLTHHPVNIDLELLTTQDIDYLQCTDIQLRSVFELSREKDRGRKTDKRIEFEKHGKNYQAEILEKPLSEYEFDEFNNIRRNAVFEANKFIQNEKIRTYFNASKIGEESYPKYLEKWQNLSKSITAILRSKGDIIGYTQIVRHGFIVNMAFQNMTYILPSYRGNNLSKELKGFIYSYLKTNKLWNDIDMIMTNNHSNNISMLNINKKLEFKLVSNFIGWIFKLQK